jgi:hypothetical protein
MDGKRAESLIKSINISDTVFGDMDLGGLQRYIYTEFVEEWERRRALEGGNRPVRQPWKVTIGNPKGQHQIYRVRDDAGWEAVHVQLRMKKHIGQKKICSSILIDAPYETFQRDSSPPVESRKSTKSSKARPHTKQTVNLISSDIESSDDTDDTSESESDGDLGSKNGKKKGARDSRTRKQLKDKRARDKSASSKDRIASQINAIHTCLEQDCPNFRGICYKLKSAKSHHEVSIAEQNKWADCILAEVKGVDLETPPAKWIASYIEGYSLQARKKSGKRKTGQTLREVAPKVDQGSAVVTTAAAPAVHYYMGPPPHPTPQVDLRPSYHDQYPRSRYIPQHHQPYYSHPLAPYRNPRSMRREVPLASSPLKADSTDEELNNQYRDYLLRNEQDKNRIAAIKTAFQFANHAYMKLEQLKSNRAVDQLITGGVKQGIALLIQEKVSDFKDTYRSAQELSAFKNAESYGMERSGEMERGQFVEEVGYSGGGEFSPNWEPDYDFFDD